MVPFNEVRFGRRTMDNDDSIFRKTWWYLIQLKALYKIKMVLFTYRIQRTLLSCPTELIAERTPVCGEMKEVVIHKPS